jgi:hypothetical protein
VFEGIAVRGINKFIVSWWSEEDIVHVQRGV